MAPSHVLCDFQTGKPSTTALLLAFVFQVATFVIKQTNVCLEASTCYMDTPSFACVSAAIYWFVAVGGALLYLLLL